MQFVSPETLTAAYHQLDMQKMCHNTQKEAAPKGGFLIEFSLSRLA